MLIDRWAQSPRLSKTWARHKGAFHNHNTTITPGEGITRNRRQCRTGPWVQTCLRIVREHPRQLNPESRDSPGNHARQQMTSPDPGGLSDPTSRSKEPSSDPCESNLEERFISLKSRKSFRLDRFPTTVGIVEFLVGDLEWNQSWLRFRESCLMAQIGRGVSQPFLLAELLEELYPFANGIQRFHVQVS